MPETRAPTVPQFTRRLGVETPEHLVLELELAGLGSRMAATVCDAGVLTLAYLLLGLGIELLPTPTRGAEESPWSTLAAVVLVLTVFLLFWGYFLLFEALNGGRTPGKRLMGIRVVMDTGHPLTFTAAAVRDPVRIVDMQPVLTYLVGLGFVLFHPQNKRLGDIVAGTVVVRDRPENLHLASAGADAVREAEPLETGSPELADEEFRLLDQLLERLEGLEGAARHRLTAELVARFALRFPRRDADHETFLARLHSGELAKRRGRLATRSAQGVGRTSIAAERFVVQKREGWETFRTLAARAERLGLKQLGAAEIPGFAAQYREVAADLARARTYGVDPRVLEYLERVVSAGHNALYGRHTGQRVPIVRLALRELPAAVVEARAFVLAALLLFALPAVTGYLAIRARRAVASPSRPATGCSSGRRSSSRAGPDSWWPGGSSPRATSRDGTPSSLPAGGRRGSSPRPCCSCASRARSRASCRRATPPRPTSSPSAPRRRCSWRAISRAGGATSGAGPAQLRPRRPPEPAARPHAEAAAGPPPCGRRESRPVRPTHRFICPGLRGCRASCARAPRSASGS